MAKNIPNGTAFESLNPEFMKTDTYKAYQAQKELSRQIDEMSKNISDSTKNDEKLRKLLDTKLKASDDVKVSKQLDSMIDLYLKQSKLTEEQKKLVVAQRGQISKISQQKKDVTYQQSVAKGFSVGGLQDVTKGRGILGGAQTGAKYAKESITNSFKNLDMTGIVKGAMHFAGGALDTPALNILASSIQSKNAKDDEMLQLLKDFDETPKESEKPSQPKATASSGIISSEGGLISAIKEVADISLENAVESEAIKHEVIASGKTLLSIDRKLGEMIFSYKDAASESLSATRATAGSDNTQEQAQPKAGEDSGLLGDALGTILGGAAGGALAKNGIKGSIAKSTKFLSKAAKMIPGIGAMVGLVMAGYDAFVGATDDEAIAKKYGIEKQDITLEHRAKVGAASAVEGATFGLVDKNMILGKDSTYTPEDKKSIANMIKGSESKNDYGAVNQLKDGAGLSVGAYQFTEKSGSLAKMMENYTAMNIEAGDFDKGPGLDLSGAVNRKSLSPEQREQMTAYLKKQQQENPERFAAAQDKTYNQMYLNPALEMADKYGIKDKAAGALFADHFHNRGAGGAKGMLEQMKAKGIDLENVDAETMAQARKDDYAQLIEKNPDKAQFSRGWNNRVNENLTKVKYAAAAPEQAPTATPAEVSSTPEGTLAAAPTNSGGSLALAPEQAPTATPEAMPNEIDYSRIGQEVGKEVAKAMANNQPAATPVAAEQTIKTTGMKMEQYSLEDPNLQTYLALYGA